MDDRNMAALHDHVEIDERLQLQEFARLDGLRSFAEWESNEAVRRSINRATANQQDISQLVPGMKCAVYLSRGKWRADYKTRPPGYFVCTFFKVGRRHRRSTREEHGLGQDARSSLAGDTSTVKDGVWLGESRPNSPRLLCGRIWGFG